LKNYLDKIGFNVINQKYLIGSAGIDIPLFPLRIKFARQEGLELAEEAGRVFGEQVLTIDKRKGGYYMNTFSISQRVGEIAAIMPKASEVFREFNIDFCCGGHRTLAEVIKTENIDEQQLLKKLEDAYEESKYISNQTNFTEMSSTKLIDYIINTHHVFLRKTLPRLSELTTKILRVHGSNHESLFRVHKALSQP